MSDIFSNANTKVQVNSFGIKDATKLFMMSDSAASASALRKQIVQESVEEEIRRNDELSADTEKRAAQSRVAMESLKGVQRVAKLNQISTEGKLVVFKDIMFEFFSKAVYLDQSFVCEKWDDLKAFTDDYIDKQGGMAYLESAIAGTKSPILKDIKAVCEKTTRAVCDKKMKRSVEENDLDVLSFDLDDEDKTQLDYDKQQLNLDVLADMVKKKVLTVVQDEQARQKTEEEVCNDIEAQLSNDDSATDAASVDEAAKRILISGPVVEESTLFNSIMRGVYKEMLEGVASVNADVDSVGDKSQDAEDYDVALKTNDKVDFDMDDAGDDDALIDEEDSEFNLDAEVFEGVSKIDMDMVLAETLCRYTMLEMAYTIKLEDYSPKEIQKISQNILN